IMNQWKFRGAGRLRSLISRFLSLFTKADVPGWYDTHARHAHRAALGEHPKLAAEHRLTQEHPTELVSASILRRNVAPSLWKLITMIPGTVGGASAVAY